MLIWQEFLFFRGYDKPTIETAVRKAMDLYSKYPHYMKGFDLVGQEDKGHPLLYFLEELLIPTQEEKELPYYFHAGETSMFCKVSPPLYSI